MLKGSKARAEWVGTERGYQGLFKQLVAEGMLVADGEHMRFSDDCAFSSPSAAAAVVSGRSANGRTAWLVEGTGQTYAAWQDQQLNTINPLAEVI
ncbi:GIY-YIG nuclease family protein OS=Stutzerimonas stutzeri OX=316 GN=G7024_23870 PE=4 SV=1 [Stutzerimonas stutzeri]